MKNFQIFMIGLVVCFAFGILSVFLFSGLFNFLGIEIVPVKTLALSLGVFMFVETFLDHCKELINKGKVINNFEKIKQMSVEEMALFFLRNYTEVENFRGRFSGLSDLKGWLLSEVEK